MVNATPFDIDATDPASPKVTIDGVDVTTSVSRLFVEVDAAVPLPVVTIQTALPGRIAGLGHVKVVHAPSGADIAAMVTALDLADMKAAVLNTPSLGTDTFAALQQVIAKRLGAAIDELDQ